MAFLAVGVCLCTLFLVVYPAGEMNRLFEYALVILCFAFACGHRHADIDGFFALLALLFSLLSWLNDDISRTFSTLRVRFQ